MILKSLINGGEDPNGNKHQTWSFIDRVIRADVTKSSDNKPKIYVILKDGGEINLCTSEETYLLNDEGKTIERIN